MAETRIATRVMTLAQLAIDMVADSTLTQSAPYYEHHTRLDAASSVV